MGIYVRFSAAVALVILTLQSLSEGANCPDLTLTSSCLTGTCASGGHLFGWTIPEIPAKPSGVSANYVGNAQFEGQVAKSVYNLNSPSACCAKCQTRTTCKFWQFVKNHPNGDKNVCFFFPKKPVSCSNNAIKTNAGAQCLDVCPDLRVNSSCNTGSCASGGQNFGWTVPILPAKPSGLPVNYVGDVQFEGQVLKAVYNAPIPTACCARCKSRQTCKYWQFVKNHPNGDSNICFFYPKNPPTCAFGPKSNAGGKCTVTGGGGDPHFIGAEGTRFDFSGLPGKSFCLLTDRSLHINMKMTGYLDERTESATVFLNGKTVRSWIRELGFIWLQGEEQHTLKLVARSTGEVQRGSGYLESAEFDGEKLPLMSPGEAVEKDGGLALKFEGYEKEGPYDVDHYTVKIEGLLDMDVRLRVAHPLLRREEDAETHFAVALKKVSSTPIIHGVLGQTYRSDRSERALEFLNLRSKLHADIVADGESGKGFLDGTTMDYVSSDVLKADCRYTGYKGHVMPTALSSE